MEPTAVARGRMSVRGGSVRPKAARRHAGVEVGSEAAVVGRAAACALVLDDVLVSSVHCELVATDRGTRIRDLGSKNGTFVGDVRVGEAYLTATTEIRCGNTILLFTPSDAETRRLPNIEEFKGIVGGTPQMRAVFERIQKTAPTSLSILILGETGTGKEVVAKAIHAASPRAAKPFVAINCASIPETLLEAELFGHEKGAFTGADRARPGLFVEAHEGTLFLDELGETTPAMQAKLLRVLEEREVRPVGGARPRKVDVRVLSATRRDLVALVNDERFRSDLYFRVAQARLELPPLRLRPDDIPSLVARMMTDLGHPAAFRRVQGASLDRLARHDWPGNVRELKNVVSVALAYDSGGAIDLAEHLTRDVGSSTVSRAGGKTYEEIRAEMEKGYFAALYAMTDGNVSEIARRAGLHRETTRSYLRKHSIGDHRALEGNRG